MKEKDARVSDGLEMTNGISEGRKGDFTQSRSSSQGMLAISRMQ